MTLENLARLHTLLAEYNEELDDRTMKLEEHNAIDLAQEVIFNDIRSYIRQIGEEHDLEDESEV